MAIATINPVTGKTIRTFEAFSTSRVSECLDRAAAAYRTHRRTPFAERAQRMRKAAAILDAECRQLGQLMTLEMGKPIGAAIAEAEKCATACRYYAENAERFLADQPAKMKVGKSGVASQPIGVVLAIMPWNFPFWQVFRFAAPALMAGNAGVLKHASNVPGCALAIEEVLRDAGFPADLFRTLLVPSRDVAKVIEHPRVVAVTLTGSTPAGRAVAGKAGSLLQKTVLELGGSDAYLILEDADLDQAVATCVASRLINSGQSCIAGKRFLLH